MSDSSPHVAIVTTAFIFSLVGLVSGALICTTGAWDLGVLRAVRGVGRERAVEEVVEEEVGIGGSNAGSNSSLTDEDREEEEEEEEESDDDVDEVSLGASVRDMLLQLVFDDVEEDCRVPLPEEEAVVYVYACVAGLAIDKEAGSLRLSLLLIATGATVFHAII